MPTKTELQDLMVKRSNEAQAIVDDAKLTPAEKREAVDKIEVDIKELSEQVKDIDYVDEKRKQYEAAGNVETSPTEKHEPKITTKTIADQVVASEAFKSLDAPTRPSVFSSGPIEVKATLTETTAGGTAGSGLAQPEVLPGILPILFQPLTIQALMPSGSTNSAIVRILKETLATNAAAAVAEGGAKPASTVNYAAVDEPVKKIATTLKVTDELFADVPALKSTLDARLMLFVQMAVEAQLASGSGVGANLLGILNRPGLTPAQAKATDSAIDAIYKDITKIRVASFLEPDAIVIHPTDWQGIRLSKDANNQYFGGGPFTGAYGVGGMAPDMLWGKRVVVTTAITVGTALIGAFATAAQVFNRGGLTVEATNSNEDDFLNNLIALRAEVRLALAVYRAAAFSTVTGL